MTTIVAASDTTMSSQPVSDSRPQMPQSCPATTLKIELDAAKNIHTLPVLLGEPLARRVNQVLMIGFFASIVGMVLAGTLGIFSLAVLIAVPRLIQVLGIYSRPKPDAPPENYPVWPLWFVSAAFVLTRSAGGLLALGLLLDAIFPIYLGG